MLVEFTLSNFRSFYKMSTFSMEASSIREFSGSIITKSKKRLLPLNIVYGANASGKTNLFYAIEVLKKIIITGGTKIGNDLEMKMFSNFWKSGLKGETTFSITFINNDSLYNYIISFKRDMVKIDNFKIIDEKFMINNVEIFVRNGNGVNYSLNKKNEKYFNKDILNDIDTSKKILNIGLVDDEVFISNGLLNILNREQIDSFRDWFENKLIINIEFNRKPLNDAISNFDLPMNMKQNLNMYSLSEFDNRITNFLKLAEIGKQEFRVKYKQDEENHSNNELFTKYILKDIGEVLFPSNLVESQGTLKLLDLIIPAFKCLDNGCVFVIDEIDSSIHPSLISAIISAFSDKEINTKNSQLIFNTQNPIYINRKLVRRDEVTFIEKNEDGSDIYSLVDLARNDSDYLKNYLEGQYGAIKYIDLTEIFSGK